MPIRTRLALGILAIVVILATPLVLALRSLERVHETTVDLRDREFGASLLLARIATGVDDLRRAEERLLFVPDVDSREAMSARISQLSAMADSLDAYALDSAARNVRAAVREIAEHAPLEYHAALNKQDALADSISSQRMVPAINRMSRWLELAERSLTERTRLRVAEAAEETRQARQLAVVLLALALGLALATGILLTRSISRPVRDLEHGMHAVAEGNLDHKLPIPPGRRDEFGRLAVSFRSMAEQLAALDRLKAEFISVASHELKTPINVIVGYVQLLEEGVYGELSPKQQEICATIQSQAQSLARLVRQLLDVSRFDAGVSRLELREVDLHALLRDLEAAFRVLALQRGITFRVTTGEGLPDQVCWDQDRINEVLGNLLSNAFRFTERSGTVELHVAASGDTVYMEVRDTGAGIPQAQLPHIFEKFYQADNQMSAASGGTGLGLAIAKQIVDAHHGTIEVESTVGVGTTFSIVLPARAAARRRTVAAPPVAAGAEA